MDLWQLTVYVSVVENKSFSKASNAINLSQPTVSSHIKELEDQFDCRLLDRLGKFTEPTKAGLILYDYAKSLLALRDQFFLVNFGIIDFCAHNADFNFACYDFLGNLHGVAGLYFYRYIWKLF